MRLGSSSSRNRKGIKSLLSIHLLFVCATVFEAFLSFEGFLLVEAFLLKEDTYVIGL